MNNRHKAKICAVDGKQEDRHWTHHWDTHHPRETVRKELQEGQEPKRPWCSNWK